MAFARRAWVCGFLLVAACQDATLERVPVAPNPTEEPDASTPAGPAPAKREGTIRVATFNVRRFFDTTCDSGNCKSGDFEAVATEAQFTSDAQRIATGIERLDPDIMVLEEIEDQKCFDALSNELVAAGWGFPVAHLGETGAPGSVDVGIFARGKLLEIKTHRQQPIFRPDGSQTTFSRELLEMRLQFGAREVVMFGAHFRSMVDDDPGRRVAEATATRDIMAATAKELPDALVMLGGDLNSMPGSDAINALELGGTLVRVAQDFPPADQGTYVYQGVAQAIDHVYVVAGQASRYVPMSAAVEDDGPGFVGSDHRALRADFKTD